MKDAVLRNALPPVYEAIRVGTCWRPQGTGKPVHQYPNNSEGNSSSAWPF